MIRNDRKNQSDYNRLREAATELYMAGKWETDNLSVNEQAQLWEDLRNALGLPKGTATERGIDG